jgi:lipoprotein-anchoring transpeptidase ErfK/SrfK
VQVSQVSAVREAAYRIQATGLAFGVALLLATAPGALALGLDKATPDQARRPAAVAGPKDKAASLNLAADAPGILSVVVSLKSQRLTLYSNGAPIATSAVSSGKPGHATPTGVFSIIQKDRFHHSTIYDDAPMYYMQRITWSGVALHQGVVPNYPASHGCVRLPEAFARQLWSTTRVGARVIISPDDVTPVDIAHPLLITHKAEPVIARRDVVIAPVKVVDAPFAVDPNVIAGARFAENAPELAGGMIASDTLFAPDAAQPAPSFARPAPEAAPLKPGPISVFISRKEGRVFIRKGFAPIFSAPVTFEPANSALGTHVFSAYAAKGDADAVRWTVVSVPEHGKTSLTAAQALDHVRMPPEVSERIASLVSAGASLIVSDQGLGPETGAGTDFIVLTH